MYVDMKISVTSVPGVTTIPYMRTATLLALSTASLLAAACTGGDIVTGYRSDGLMVTCEGQGDDLSKCTPDDGDSACETWQNGGAANVLWPPNHKLIRFTLDACGVVTDSCTSPPASQPLPPPPSSDGSGPVILLSSAQPAAGAPARITAITADEEVEVGAGGDGHTTDYDVAIIDDVTFDLRSERQGGGDGRVYRVHYVDQAGAPGICEFLVPHDRGPVNGAVDSGVKVSVTR
jgi:hypothetical protein